MWSRSGSLQGIVLLTVGIDEAGSRLAFDVDSEAVAELNEVLGGRVVGCAHPVHVGLLEEDGIDAVGGAVGRASAAGIHIMTAGTAQFHGHSVHKHAVAFDFYIAESYLFSDG